MAASMTRLSKKAAAGRAAVPMRIARLSVRAQAMDNNTPKQFRSEAEAMAATAALPSSTPFDSWKFAPIREATVSATPCSSIASIFYCCQHVLAFYLAEPTLDSRHMLP